MAHFVDGKTFKRISLQTVHAPFRGTLSIGLWGGYEVDGRPLTVSSSDTGIATVTPARDQADYRMFTVRGLELGQTTIAVKARNGGSWDTFTTMVHQPRTKQLPPYETLAANYAGDEESSEDFRARIGGQADNDDYANTCTLRISEAFNGSGQPIPRSTAKLLTVLGGDKHHYAIRVAEFKKFLTETYGPPDLVRQPTPPAKAGVSRSAFNQLRGVICFEVQFSDATGHFTLWDGTSCVHGDYFDRAYRVSLWMAA